MQVISQSKNEGRYSGGADLVDFVICKEDQKMFGRRMYWKIWSQEI